MPCWGMTSVNPRERDEAWMAEALALAARGIGLTRPNPPVGAVVVRKGAVVGRGWHRKAGGPHAEVFAMGEAGEKAQGATIYVTLEPCSTHGRTPPCTEAILAAGIRRVVYAVRDPNPRHAGRASHILRGAGIEVVEGVGRETAEALLLPFRIRTGTGRPMITLKLAVSLDGRIADARGRSRWITGPRARAWVQDLRRTADGILVGAETVRRDDPSLLPRPARGRKPWRIILDGTDPLPVRHRVFSDGHADQTLLITHHGRPDRLRRLDAAGVSVLHLPRGPRGYPLARVARLLGDLGLLHVVCEGGGRLAGSLIRAGLVDRLAWIAAPILLGQTGRPAVGAPWTLATAPHWRPLETRSLGRDTLHLLAREG